MENIEIIIYDNEEITKTLVENYLKELIFPCTLKYCRDLNSEYITSADSPKIILFDINGYDAEVFEKMAALAENKNIIIAAMSGSASANMQVKAFRAGAKDFLIKPLVKSDFINKLKFIYRRYIYKTGSNKEAKIYTAVSDRRGNGKSGFLINLAYELADISSEKVLFMDFNSAESRISMLMQADSIRPAAYYINNLSFDNAEALLADIPRYKNTSLYLAAEKSSAKGQTAVKKDSLPNALNILKKHFKYIIIDTPYEDYASLSASVYNKADEIFCIVLPFAGSYDEVKKILDNYGRDKNIKIILNQYTAENDLKIAKIQPVLGREIFWKIPKNYTAFKNAEADNIIMIEAAQETEIAAAYFGLAKYLVNRN